MRAMICAAGLAFMLMGCDSGQPTPATAEHVWSAQTRALEAAKDVERAAQAAAQERNHAIDEQSQ